MIFQDVLTTGLKIVFCGTAPGKKSAELRQYYADPRNKFWKVLHKTGLTATQLDPSEYKKLLVFDIGLTDLDKSESGVDRKLNYEAFDLEAFSEKIVKMKPVVLAFTSKFGASVYLGNKKLKYGLQNERIDNTKIWILPSTSGSNAHWDKSKHFRHWKDLADYIKKASYPPSLC